ncbi:pyridoxamine 5'-phosphate oxidase family protein [Nonomuraea gerenzanensis]|uniref:Probable iron-sulfur binding protein YPO1417 n=1 Tax=Nonomuraea gerenzanensis TaxID=93944 RepID=A0A1M4EKY3_9ACTN|nr:pyridoxamine 5'-phosphate oxidase family protein [Nonomuraea gerenzanensis]UBU11062.1 pyridoxamine 5'-phosphate oxidase family protein [Nonomuraea gerenzanensis]SBO99517.1 probable iron-sulfur binding protein YPO1417 [Nonomuraea gerenzanensis]
MARHPGEVAVQRRAGVRLEEHGSSRTRPELPAVAAAFLRDQRMIVAGAADDLGRLWASVLTGPAGFADVVDDRTMVLHALPAEGDPLHGLFAAERDLGLLAIEPHTRRRMRVNGTAVQAGQSLVVWTEQVYSNCPKYIQTREPATAPGSPALLGGGTSLAERQQGWIAAADTFFIATRAAGFGADVSHRGGNPGFVRVTGPRSLEFPDYPGNGMFMTLGNLELDPAAGLLFPDWERGETLQLTGRARVEWGERPVVRFELDAYAHLAGLLPAGWSAPGYHRFNPPV